MAYLKEQNVTYNNVTVKVAIKKEDGEMIYADILQDIKVGELAWNFVKYESGMAKLTIFEAGKQRGLGYLAYNGKNKTKNWQRMLSNVLREYKGIKPLKILEENQDPPVNPTPQPQKPKNNVMSSALDTIEFGYEESGATEEVVPATPVVVQQPVKKMPSIQIWTDGSSLGNPGKGGWAAVFVMGDKALPIYGSSPSATNNQMEAQALVEAVEWLDRPSNVEVYLDSEYVEKIANGTNSAKKNADLWQRYFAAAQRHNITLHHVDGHSGIKLNEFCDQLAKRAAEDQLRKPDRSMSSKLRRNVNELSIKAKAQQTVEDIPAILQDDDDRYYADDGYPDEDNYLEEE